MNFETRLKRLEQRAPAEKPPETIIVRGIEPRTRECVSEWAIHTDHKTNDIRHTQ